jgi:hypothetical protein
MICEELKAASAEAVATVKTIAIVIRITVTEGFFAIVVWFHRLQGIKKNSLCIKSYETSVLHKYKLKPPPEGKTMDAKEFSGSIF